MAGRTTVDPPLIGWVLVLNDGTMVRNWSFRSPAPRLTKSVADSTSTGTADFGGAARLRAGADDHRFLCESREQPAHLRRRQSQGLDLGRRHSKRATQLLDQRVRPALRLFLRVVVLISRARGGRELGPYRQEQDQHEDYTPHRAP